MDWTETEKRHPDKGSIALQVSTAAAIPRSSSSVTGTSG